MTAISVKHLKKSFKVKEKKEGFKGSLKTIFNPSYKVINAVDDVSFFL